MRTRLAKFASDQQGVALLEFSLLAPILALLCVGAIDFGLAFASQMQLAAAVEEGAQYAFVTGPTVQPATVQSIVQTASPLSAVTAAVTYNQTACYCPAGAPPVLAAQTCGQPCADGSMPGKFLSISADYTYSPIFPAYGLIANPKMTQAATVRVQ